MSSNKASPNEQGTPGATTGTTPDTGLVWWGGRRLFQLLETMAAQKIHAYRIEARKIHVTMTRFETDGTETASHGWTGLELRGAILYLRKEIRGLEDWRLGTAPVEAAFTLDPMSGLLPPGMSALRCAYTAKPPSEMSLDLRVLTAEEAQAAPGREAAS